MDKDKFKIIAEEAVKLYFDYNLSAKEAIEKAKEVVENEKACCLDR